MSLEGIVVTTPMWESVAFYDEVIFGHHIYGFHGPWSLTVTADSRKWSVWF